MTPPSESVAASAPDARAEGAPEGVPLPHDAVVLAGGAARRLGGVSKAEVVVAGRMLLDHVLDATRAARRRVVVGPPRLARPGVPTVLEHPVSGGPVAGIDAGLASLDPGDDDVAVLVLACDVPQASQVVPRLLAGLAADPVADGARLVDADGHGQLVVVYRRPALRRALADLQACGGVHGVSVRRLDDALTMLDVPDPARAGADADTWDDVRTLDELISGRRSMTQDHEPQDEGARTAGPAPGRDNGPAAAGSPLHRWVATLVDELGVDPDAVDVDLLLDLARDVAHQVARPAVPITTFLLGYAVAGAGADRAALERLAGRVTELAAGPEAGR